MSFNHKYNTDDAIIRANIVGLVKELNDKITFENVWENDKVETVRVPFFYAMSGDERFLQDYFSNWSDCAPDFIEGNTDPIPRGTIFLTGYSVLASNMTSRYVRGYYTKVIDGQLKRFNSYINSIPIQLNFSAEILVDTSIDSFKIVQAITAFLYRTQTFSVNFKGFRVPTQVGFPDSYNIGKQFEFTYGNTERIKVTFEIEIQSFLPVIDQTNEFFGGKQISGISTNIGASFASSEAASQDTLTGKNPQIEEIMENTVKNPENSQSSSLTPGTIPTESGNIPPSIDDQTTQAQDNYTNPGDAQPGKLNEGSISGSKPDAKKPPGIKPDDEFTGDYWR